MKKLLTALAVAVVAMCAGAQAHAATIAYWPGTSEVMHTIAYNNWDGQYWLPTARVFGYSNPELTQDIDNCKNWYDAYTPDIVFGADLSDFYSAKIRMYDSYSPDMAQSGLTWVDDGTQDGARGQYALMQFNEYFQMDPNFAQNDWAQPAYHQSHHWSVTHDACHELGHAMGLAHDNGEGGVMQEFWTGNWGAIPLQDEGNYINWIYHYHNLDDGL